MLQVFANAFLFNPRESNVGVMATTLQVRNVHAVYSLVDLSSWAVK